MLSLVNGALEIIRLEAGATELDLGLVSLDPIIDDALQTIGADAAAREVTIAFDPPWPAHGVLGDPRALRTVAINLIQNAVTWSPPGGTVRISRVADGALIRLEVTDEGEGVDPGDLPRLMQPFEQGENALSRRSGGAGLGWPLVRLLVKAMGGEFYVDPGPGEGLRAVVTLRRAG